LGQVKASSRNFKNKPFVKGNYLIVKSSLRIDSGSVLC
jgi:hypothetical protein